MGEALKRVVIAFAFGIITISAMNVCRMVLDWAESSNDAAAVVLFGIPFLWYVGLTAWAESRPAAARDRGEG